MNDSPQLDKIQRDLQDSVERRVYQIEELPEDIVQAISEAKMDPKHEHLNALLDE